VRLWSCNRSCESRLGWFCAFGIWCPVCFSS